jgi:cell division protein FtsQ
VKKRKLYRILFLLLWVVVLSGVTVLLVSANKKNVGQVCTGVNIVIKPENSSFFIEKNELLSIITNTGKSKIISNPVSGIDLPLIEKNLESDPWISNAELYFDSKNILNVLVTERVPIARIITKSGTSFYMDEEGKQMPIVAGKPIQIQVVTGFTPAKKWNKADTAMFQGMKQVVNYISNDKFWNAQVGQIDITPRGDYELIPVVGDHVIRLGSAEGVDSKLNRLFLFYKHVLSKAGFNKYAALDVEYEGQIVAVKKGNASSVDSVQLKRNIEELLRQKELQLAAEQKLLEQETDAVAIVDDSKVNSTANMETVKEEQSITPSTFEDKPIQHTVNNLSVVKKVQQTPIPVKTTPVPIQNHKTGKPVPMKTTNPPDSANKKAGVKENLQPKAVMPRREQAENEY